MRKQPTLSRFKRDAARRLRSSETLAERRFRRGLAAISVPGSHFRRQAPIGRYIADFACHRYRLVIELDGGQHADAAAVAHDIERTRYLKERGYTVLRFWNNEVLENLEGCLEIVMQVVASTSPSTGEVGRPCRPGGGGKSAARYHTSPARCADPPRQGEGGRRR